MSALNPTRVLAAPQLEVSYHLSSAGARALITNVAPLAPLSATLRLAEVRTQTNARSLPMRFCMRANTLVRTARGINLTALLRHVTLSVAGNFFTIGPDVGQSSQLLPEWQIFG
jgi:hypothetical protein